MLPVPKFLRKPTTKVACTYVHKLVYVYFCHLSFPDVNFFIIFFRVIRTEVSIFLLFSLRFSASALLALFWILIAKIRQSNFQTNFVHYIMLPVEQILYLSRNANSACWLALIINMQIHTNSWVNTNVIFFTT